MSSSQFAERSKSGDLLLFRGFEFPAKCQRYYTTSHYDHVALLVKRYFELEVYETTSAQVNYFLRFFILNQGCKIRPWRFFISNQWVYSYDKIIYRELIYDKKKVLKDEKNLEEILKNKLDDFLSETRDKDYKLPANIICCPGKREYEEKNNWEKSKGFFCSQLIAAAYFKMEVLKYDKCSLRYFPGDFSQSSNLGFTENFRFGPEILVDFSQ